MKFVSCLYNNFEWCSKTAMEKARKIIWFWRPVPFSSRRRLYFSLPFSISHSHSLPLFSASRAFFRRHCVSQLLIAIFNKHFFAAFFTSLFPFSSYVNELRKGEQQAEDAHTQARQKIIHNGHTHVRTVFLKSRANNHIGTIWLKKFVEKNACAVVYCACDDDKATRRGKAKMCTSFVVSFLRDTRNRLNFRFVSFSPLREAHSIRYMHRKNTLIFFLCSSKSNAVSIYFVCLI